MEPDAAIGWVTKSKVIASHARRLESISAYEARDYMQNAVMAALKAIRRSPDTNSEEFRKTFWGIFNQQNRSRSIPTTRCTSDEVELFGIYDSREPRVDYCRIIYQWGAPALSVKEAQVLKLALGLERDGKLSERAIAATLKISQKRTHQLLTSAVTKIIALIEDGDTKYMLRILFDAIKDSLHHSNEKGD